MDDYARTLTAIGDREMRVDTAAGVGGGFSSFRRTPEYPGRPIRFF